MLLLVSICGNGKHDNLNLGPTLGICSYIYIFYNTLHFG